MTGSGLNESADTDEATSPHRRGLDRRVRYCHHDPLGELRQSPSLGATMTNETPPPPAGWYPAAHAGGEMRYWDGTRWLEGTQPAADPVPAVSPIGADPTVASSPDAVAPPPPGKKQGLPWWGWLLIGVGALIALIIIIGSINSANDAADDDEPAATASEPAAEPTEDQTAEEEQPTEEPATPAIEHQEWSGTGDFVIDVDLSSPAIVGFSCELCTGNTVLETNGSEALLVNEIGAYTGSKLINVNDNSATTRFVITADAAWTLTVDDITTAQAVTGPATGAGDSVILMQSEFDVAAITNDGEGNFVIYAYGDGNLSPLIVNEIGAYSGTVPMAGPAFVEVSSTGNWSITPQ
jgi:hypothetical protein